MRTLALYAALIVAAFAAVALPTTRQACTFDEMPMPWQVTAAAAKGCGLVR